MAILSSETRFGVITPFLYLVAFLIIGSTISSNPSLAFIISGFVIFAFFFFHTKYAVYTYSIYLAFEETILQYLPQQFYLFLKYSGDLLLLLLAAAVFVKLTTRRYNLSLLRKNPINIPLVCFVIIVLLSTIINEVPPFIAFVGLRQILRFVLLYYLVLIISSSEWDVKSCINLFYIMVGVVIIQAVFGYAQAALGPGSKLNYLLAPGRAFYYEGVRISGGLTWAEHKGVYGTMLVRNTYGVFISFFVLMMLGIAHKVSERQRLYKWLLIFIIPVVFFSYSRQAIYGMFLGMFAIAFIANNKKLLLALLMGALVFALAVSQFRIESPAITEKASLIEKIASPFQTRYIKWSMKADRLYAVLNFGPKIITSKYALIGTGPASFGSPVGESFKYYEGYKKYDIGRIAPKYFYAISDTGFLVLLGQYGILGLASLMWIFTALFLYVKQMYLRIEDPYFQGMALGVLGVIPALLFSNVGYINLDLRQVSFYFWLLMALTLSYWGKETLTKLEAAGFRKEEVE